MRRADYRFFGFFVLLAALVALFFLSQRPPLRIAILTGFDGEAAAFSGVIEGARTQNTDAGPVTFGRIAGHDILLAAVGPGMTNAAARTQAILDLFPVSHIIVAGTAGSLDGQFAVGAVVIPQFWRSHQYGAAAAGGFQPYPLAVLPFGQAAAISTEGFAADPALLALAAGIEGVSVGGIGISGDSFIADPRVRDALHAQFAAAVTDMETAAVAQVAFINGVPFAAVRVVSDLADAASPIDSLAVFARPPQVVREMISKMP